jgi:sulfoxide reductase catalytic subunit YedY
MKRRDFFKTSLVASATLLANSSFAGNTRKPNDTQSISKISFPQKRAMITYSDRPPLLETPRDGFSTAITPNSEFFVRWHSPKFPTSIDADDYRIYIHGEVQNRLYISLDELKNSYESVEITAVLQCGGNSRSAFTPTTSGIQWGSGAMGCAIWRGVRLKDILKQAKLTNDAQWIYFNGKDKPLFNKAPRLVRGMKVDEISDDIIIAYEMNGEDLPLLNGYPVRLVIPGLYSDSWVKMLSEITITDKAKSLYYMDVAYRVPDNECECESQNRLFGKTKPITTMNVKSLIAHPTSNTLIHKGTKVDISGIAFDSGDGIREVLISLDNAASWQSASLQKELSPYAFRVFNFSFTPTKSKKITIMAKAISNTGKEQPFAHEIQWNHGGYKYNEIDSVTINMV